MMSDEKKSPAVWDVKCTSADCRYGPYNVCHYRGPHPSVDGRCTYEGCPIRADCEEKLAEAERDNLKLLVKELIELASALKDTCDTYQEGLDKIEEVMKDENVG